MATWLILANIQGSLGRRLRALALSLVVPNTLPDFPRREKAHSAAAGAFTRRSAAKSAIVTTSSAAALNAKDQCTPTRLPAIPTVMPENARMPLEQVL